MPCLTCRKGNSNYQLHKVHSTALSRLHAWPVATVLMWTWCITATALWKSFELTPLPHVLAQHST